MKKRVLSFLLACFMVVSTFIISRPLVDVHAVDNAGTRLDMTPVFDGTSRFDTEGNVELAGYDRDAEGEIEDKIYTEGLTTAVDGASWYVLDTRFPNSGSLQRLWKAAVNGSIEHAGGHHYVENSDVGEGIGSALIFTAPRDGKYEFVFTQNSSWAGSSNNKCGNELLIMDEDGNVLASVVNKVNNTAKTAQATVTLEKNEKIYIVRCPMKKGVDGIVNENKSTHGAASVSIAQLDYVSQPDGTRRDMTPVFDGTSRFDTKGNVELAGYKRDAEGSMIDKIYTEGLDVYISKTHVKEDGSAVPAWVVRDTTLPLSDTGGVGHLWRGTLNTDASAPINYAGGHHYVANSDVGDGIGSALIFTAPVAGEYEFAYSQHSGYTAAWTEKAGFEMFILDSDGDVLSSATVTAQGKTTVVSATVKLKKNEKVYILRSPLKKGENGIGEENRSSNGAASVTITQLDYIPYAEGERLDMTPVFDGTSLFDTTGNVELVGYKRGEGIYRDGLSTKLDGTNWYVIDSNLNQSGSLPRLWRGTVGGQLNYAGGHHNEGQLANNNFTSYGNGIGSALIFTAPRDGKYEFGYSQHSSWAGSNKCGFDILIQDKDGNVLNSISLTSSSIERRVSTVVTLKKGDVIYIIRCPKAVDGTTIMAENVSTNGAASVSIAQLDYLSCDNGCPVAYLISVGKTEPTSHIAHGMAAHYRCANCGKLYADADATVPTTKEELLIQLADPFVEPEKVGQTFYAYKRYKAERALAERPNTFEAWIKVPTDATDKRIGAIYSNHEAAYQNAINFEIEAGGNPQLRWQIQWNKADQITFDEIDVRTGEWLHLVIVRDIENQVGYCYVNGELKQTASFLNCNGYIETSTSSMCVGGGNTSGNSYMFKQSRIHSVAAYSDMRTASEIASDYANGITDADDLLAYYIISPEGNERLRDYSAYQNHLTITNQGMSAVEEKYIPEMSTENYGTKFGWNDNYIEAKLLDKYPRKIEATVYFPDQFLDNVRGGVIVSDYLGKVPTFAFEIYSSGAPRLYIQNNSGASHDITFATVNVYNGKKTNIEVVIEADAVKLYVDGVLAETKTVSGIGAFVDAIKPSRKMIVGGDYRERNEQYFKGQLIDLTVSSSDAVIAEYDFSNASSYPAVIEDKSGNGYDLKKSGYLLDYEAPEDFAYSLLVLGDTQYMNDRYPENFVKIYDWILANKDAHKIQYVMGVGDITDTDDASEWNRAKKQFDRLNGKVPYSLVIGNHDGSEKMNATFNTPEYNATFDGKYGDGIENSYRLITVGKVKYLIMTIEFGYRDEVIDWANEVIAAHPDYNVIITTHGYLESNGTGLLCDDTDTARPSHYDETLNDADVLWDNLVSKHANISFVICGHVGASTVHTLDAVGDNGNVVKQILVNPQGFDARHPGGLGMVTLLYFNEDGTEMDIRTYSTVYDGEHHDEVSYDPSVNVVKCTHTGFWKDGICSECGAVCPGHTGGEATCQKGAICEICGKEYTEKNPNNHIEAIEIELGGNGDGTHDWLCEGCKEVVGPNEKCTYENNVCIKCRYDCTIEVETEDLNNAIDNILNGGNATITVVGPTTTMDEAFVVEKIENVVGYEYKYFNIDFDENGKLFLRHHFIVTGELPTVTVDGVAKDLKQDEGYNTYYIDTYYEAGEYDIAKTIVVNGDTYRVSLYSYIKLALEGEVELTKAEETLLRALYDLNEAMRNK